MVASDEWRRNLKAPRGTGLSYGTIAEQKQK